MGLAAVLASVSASSLPGFFSGIHMRVVGPGRTLRRDLKWRGGGFTGDRRSIALSSD